MRTNKSSPSIILPLVFRMVVATLIDGGKLIMTDVDKQAEEIVKSWEGEDESNGMSEEGVFGDEGWSIRQQIKLLTEGPKKLTDAGTQACSMIIKKLLNGIKSNIPACVNRIVGIYQQYVHPC